MRCGIIKRLVSRSEGRHSPVFSEHPKTQAEPLVADACAAGIKEVLDSEGFYVGPPVGVSMWPMLRNRRDAILVVPASERLKRYDVALYRRGQMMVLHRVLGLYENGYVICGDNCIALERVPLTRSLACSRAFTETIATLTAACRAATGPTPGSGWRWVLSEGLLAEPGAWSRGWARGFSWAGAERGSSHDAVDRGHAPH